MKSKPLFQAVGVVLSFGVLMGSTAHADETITCPAVISTSIDENVLLTGTGTCTLAVGASIDGEVSVANGVSFIVQGTVAGKIDEVGVGRVIVDGGFVENDIIETRGGAIRVINFGYVTGNLDESGGGRVEVRSSTVNGDVLESGGGNVIIRAGMVDGNVDEADGGSVAVDGNSTVSGNVFEEGDGNCAKVVVSSVEGVVDCD